MSTIEKKAEWVDDIYELSKQDLVEGDAEGISNKQAQQLANRTDYLKEKHDQYVKGRKRYIQFQSDTDDSPTVLLDGGPTGSTTLSLHGTLACSGDVISFANLSDKRLKDKIEPITDALNKVLKLNGYTYELTLDKSEQRRAGVIAQEVLEVLPEVIQTTDSGYLSVSYGNMIALFIEAIKELTDKVDTQEKQIQELKNLLRGGGLSVR